ncbi:MAG: response regulator [Chromatiales bacterium]|nr:response regulator [Chromatiales bacterium]
MLLGLTAERPLGDAGDTRSVIVVNDSGGKRAVLVDALLSGRDLVIKNLAGTSAPRRGSSAPRCWATGRCCRCSTCTICCAAGAAPPGRCDRSWCTAARRRASAPDILVVDDSLTVRQTLTLLLEGDGYGVHAARDGVEALEYVTRVRPAALVVDLEMPRMNGLELTERLRASERTRGLPVIMLTSRSSEKHREQARLAGVDLYLTKPYRDEDLLAQLRSMLNKAA